MNLEMLLVFGILLATIALFTTDWLRLDLVALMSLLALLLTGILTPSEALAGFANPLVLIIAGLFVVGAGLFRTGVADMLGTWLGKIAGNSPTRVIAVVMVVVGVLSGFMSSTGTVAILLPVVVSLAARVKLNPSKLLIPLAFASLLGGMLTLIGTPPNIVVSEQLSAQGLEPFGFFTFTPIGLVMLVLGVGFMALLGRHLLPDRSRAGGGEPDEQGPESVSASELAQSYGLPGNLIQLRVRADAPLIGKTVVESQIGRRYRVTILEFDTDENPSTPGKRVQTDRPFRADDVVLVHGLPGNVNQLCAALGFEVVRGKDGVELLSPLTAGLAEVLLTPRSRLIGRTLKDSRFRDLYDLTVLSVLRLGKTIHQDLISTPLRFGDTLLVQGEWERIRTLRRQVRDFVVISEPAHEQKKSRFSRRTIYSLVIMVGMLVLMTTGIVPTVTAILLAAIAMVLTRCLTTGEAYGSMSWESLVLIAAMLPMATALKKTGGMELVVGWLTTGVGQLGPLAVMGGLFVLTSAFSQFISNTATTVLVAPIAFQAATAMEVSPRTFLMTVAIAASTAFATPIASPVNTLVLTAGGYRFTDYTKAGVLLQLLLMATTLVLVPLLFPL